MDQLINKYLNKSLTRKEARELESWLSRDVRNRIEFENIVAHLSHKDGELETIKDRILDRVIQEENVAVKLNFGQKIRYISKVAAIFIIVFGAVIFLILNEKEESTTLAQHQPISHIEKEAAYGQQLSFKLPDGTMVKLNSGSKLIFPKDFSNQSRDVALVGEAFFDVERDESRPFNIKAHKVNVRVLGTSFSVRSYEDESNVVVGVKTGIVRVTNDAGNQEVILKENDLADYSNISNKLTKEVISENAVVFGWINRELVLKDYNINQIMVALSRWYDVSFEVQGDLDKQRKFTTRYKDPTLKSVMESLAYAYEFEYQIDNKIITIMK